MSEPPSWLNKTRTIVRATLYGDTKGSIAGTGEFYCFNAQLPELPIWHHIAKITGKITGQTLYIMYNGSYHVKLVQYQVHILHHILYHKLYIILQSIMNISLHITATNTYTYMIHCPGFSFKSFNM